MQTHVQNLIKVMQLLKETLSEHWHLMNFLPFKVMIMSRLILVMASLLNTSLTSCFKIGFRASGLFFQKPSIIENFIQFVFWMDS